MNRFFYYIKIVLPVLVIGIACEREIPFILDPPQVIPEEGITATSFTQEAGKSVFLGFTLQAVAGLDELRVTLNGEIFDQVFYTRGELSAFYVFEYAIPADSEEGEIAEFNLALFDLTGRVDESYSFKVITGLPFEIIEVEIDGITLTKIKGKVNGDLQLFADQIYLIDSVVSIEDNGILEIEAGTTVYFRTFPSENIYSRLAITQGSKIIAEGTRENPIVFTSDRELFGGTSAPRDWAAISIYGRAPTNQGGVILEDGFRYGGDIENDDSGILKFVRIEYTGKGPGQGFNALYLFGVGSNTIIENVEVYRSENIAFRLKGGNVSLKSIAAIGYGGYGIWADGGWRGRGQFWIFQTDRAATLVPINFWNQARAIEMRNDANFFQLQPRTEFQISNVTCIGNGYLEGENLGTRRGVRIRRGAFGQLQNLICTEFPNDGIRVEDLAIETLGVDMILDNVSAYNNNQNYNQEAESFFFENGDFNVTETPVPGITLDNFVGSLPSNFNPTQLGSWFEPAQFIGAVENDGNDWTRGGTWFRNLDGTIRE